MLRWPITVCVPDPNGFERNPMSVTQSIHPRVIQELAQLFRERGYVRRQDPKKRKKKKQKYHRGDEVRIMVSSKGELKRLRYLLRRAGFKPGRHYPQKAHFRQPVYGVRATTLFLEMVSEHS